MKIGFIYQYVFEDLLKLEIEKIEKNTQISDKARAIENKKNKVREEFKTLRQSDLSDSFRFLLREQANNLLEDLLYSNHTDKLYKPANYSYYQFPNLSSIKEKFQILNGHYHFFIEQTHEAENHFIIAFRGCKLIADYIEKNNDAENDLVSLHAYKLILLFGISTEKNKNPFQKIELYYKTHNFQGNKFIHDVLVYPIPVNNPPIQKLLSWQKLIQISGQKAINLFQQAPAIENKLANRSPSNILEAETAAGELIYKRHSEYPELADLCRQYHLEETLFEKCLGIEKNRKKSDRIPEIEISGDALGYPGYYLVKLPIADPRAYLLGYLTGSCQSIGGHAEQCVVDGITLQNNGFYVLLKRNSKKAASPIVNGKIDYQIYNIVGQGYIWFSVLGNLTIDSWENLRPEIDDQTIIPLLQAFAKQVAEAENSTIVRVTIGLGGKTPAGFKSVQPTLSN